MTSLLGIIIQALVSFAYGNSVVYFTWFLQVSEWNGFNQGFLSRLRPVNAMNLSQGLGLIQAYDECRFPIYSQMISS